MLESFQLLSMRSQYDVFVTVQNIFSVNRVECRAWLLDDQARLIKAGC